MHAPQTDLIPVDLLLRAYRAGIFPMSDHRQDHEVFWIEPKQRAIIPLDGFQPSRSLRKRIRQNHFRVTINADFAAVIAACAEPRPDHGDTWISERIQASYCALNQAGHAHSVECWHGDALVGGLYGVAFDRVFCGESMFSRTSDASKVALAWLVAAMREAGYVLLDCQFMTSHLATMGAVEIPQEDYLDRVKAARGAARQSLPQAWSSLSSAAVASG